MDAEYDEVGQDRGAVSLLFCTLLYSSATFHALWWSHAVCVLTSFYVVFVYVFVLCANLCNTCFFNATLCCVITLDGNIEAGSRQHWRQEQRGGEQPQPQPERAVA